MTDPTTLIALAERCEQAARPDRELDADIALAIGYTHERRGTERARWWRTPSGQQLAYEGYKNHPPFFTGSLDAAIALVPEGHEWLRKTPQTMTVYRVPADLKEWARHIDAGAAPPALALCAAALRARAAAHD
jgi:hypothetical protein